MFTKRFIVAAGVLSATCLVLAGVLLMQGPRIRRVEVDTKGVTIQTGQRIILRANQPLRSVDAKDVTIEPTTSYSVMKSGDAVILQLNERLAYNTDYRIRVKGLRAENRSKTTEFSHTFKTDDATLYYLRRRYGPRGDGAKLHDQILRRKLHDKSEEIVYEAPKIKEFAQRGTTLLISTSESTTSDKLHKVNLTTKASEEIPLPGKGLVGSPQIAVNNRDYGYLFTPADQFVSTLRIYDSAAKVSFTVEGLDGKELSVSEWRFTASATAAIVQSPGSGTLLVDTTFKNKPAFLGNFDQVFDFSSDGTRLLASDASDLVVFDIIKRTKSTLEPARFDGFEAIPNTGLFAGHDSADPDATLQHAFTYGRGGSFNRVFEKSGTRVTTFLNQELNDGGILALNAPANRQYIGLEIYAPSAEYDGYQGKSMPKGAKTVIYDTTNQATIGDRVDGFGLVWD
jgi:hypothetical protein